MELIEIGRIETPFEGSEGAPIQPFASHASGIVHVSAQYADALLDIEGFERIWLIFWCDKVKPAQMKVTPFMDKQSHGLFATRVPSRPNPIGISSVKLDRVDNLKLYVSEVDMLNNTPLLDIKPYVSKFDNYPTQRNGWFDKVHHKILKQGKSDKRFQL